MAAAVLTFREIIDAVADEIQDTGVDRERIIKRRINLEYKGVARKHAWQELFTLRESAVQIGTIDEKLLPLPADLEALYYLGDNVNGVSLHHQSPQRFWSAIMGQKDTIGTGFKYTNIGSYPQQNVKAANGTILVASDEAADAGQKVRLVFDSFSQSSFGGLRKEEEVTLTGITPVASTISMSAGLSLAAMSLDEDTAGATVGHIFALDTFPITAATEVYGIIEPARRAARMSRWIRIWPTGLPPGPVVMVYKRIIRKMIDDENIPEIPVDEYLVEKATAGMYRQLKKTTQAGKHDIEAQRFLQDVIDQQIKEQEHTIQSFPIFGSIGMGSQAGREPFGLHT